MNDIVKRLRAEDPECGLRHSLAMEAADEIERLRVWLESGGGRYWEGRYRDEAAMVDKLQEALIAIINTAPFGKPQEIARSVLGKEDA
jgi:hypothetical protein